MEKSFAIAGDFTRQIVAMKNPPSSPETPSKKKAKKARQIERGKEQAGEGVEKKKEKGKKTQTESEKEVEVGGRKKTEKKKKAQGKPRSADEVGEPMSDVVAQPGPDDKKLVEKKQKTKHRSLKVG